MDSSPSVIVNCMELDMITWRSNVGWFAAVFYDPTADRCPCEHHRSKYECDEFLYVPLMSFPGHVLVIFAASWRWRSWTSVLLWMHLLQPLLLLWWLCLVVPGTAWHCMPAACLVQPSYTHTHHQWLAIRVRQGSIPWNSIGDGALKYITLRPKWLFHPQHFHFNNKDADVFHTPMAITIFNQHLNTCDCRRQQQFFNRKRNIKYQDCYLLLLLPLWYIS